jgi:glycosyltransferase involved in cell wall biosynthesis
MSGVRVTDMPGAPTGRRLTMGMALYGDLTFDSRVRKEARSLAEAGYDVVVVCLASGGSGTDLPPTVRVVICRPPESSVIPGAPNPFIAPARSRLTAVRRRLSWFTSYARGLRAWGRLVVDAAGPIDIWHAHDLTGLAAIVPHLPHGTPVVYDSHELFLEAGTASRLPGMLRGLLRKYERRLIARSVAVITVNDEIADVVQRRYRPARIAVVHNCPDRWIGPAVVRPLLREATGIPDGQAIVLYHGALTSGRGIELLAEAMAEPGLEDAHLVLMGMGDRREAYVGLADDPRWGGRIHVLPPVGPSELMPWVASADVGAIPNPGGTLNDRFSAPNKLFECLAAGTPVVAADFPTLHRIVMDDPHGPLGTVCDTSRAGEIAVGLRAIVGLDPDARAALRARCVRAATERWNWQAESVALIELYAAVAADLPGSGPA